MWPCFLKVRLIFVRIHLLLLFIVYKTVSIDEKLTLVSKSPINILVYHLHRMLKNFLIQKVFLSIRLVKHVDQFNQSFPLFVFKFTHFGVLFNIGLKVGDPMAELQFELENICPAIGVNV